MDIWLFDIMFWPKPGNRQLFPYPGRLWDAQAGMDAYASHIRYLQHADALGFDGICFAEHHFAPYGICPSPNLMAGVMATHTSYAKLVLMGNCLPLHGHPVRVAEELAMIDVLSKGRVVSGLLRGGFTEWFAYSLDADETRGRFEEAWELIVKCWTEPEPFAWQSKFFQYDNISIMPRPVQQPHPKILMAGSTAESIEWAARKRAPIAASFAPVESMRDTFNYYRKYATEECGWTPGPESALVSRQVYVAETNEKARADSEGYLLGFFDEVPTARRLSPKVEEYRARGRSVRSYDYKADQTAGHQFLADAKATAVATTAAPSGNYSFDQLQRDGLCIIGDPDYVTAEIKRQQEALGVGTFIIYTPFGLMPLDMAQKSIEMFAKHVRPNL